MGSQLPYSVIAEYYDEISSRIMPVFEKAYAKVLADVKSEIRSVCDLCCGSGSQAINFAMQGLEVYAIDRIETFSHIIRDKALKAKVNVQFIQADMKEFQLPEQVDLVTCMFDSLNLLERKTDLCNVFDRISNILHPGGYLAFDVNTEKALKEMWPKFPIFLYEGKGWLCIRRGKLYDSQRKVGSMESLLFKQREQGLWTRQSEIYNEIAWTDQEIEKTLKDASFEVLRSWDAKELGTSKEEGLRLFYLAKRRD